MQRRIVIVGLSLLLACGDDGSPVAVDASGTETETEGVTTGSSSSDTESSSGDSSTGGPVDEGDPFDPVPPFEPLSDDRVAGLQATIDGALAQPSVSSATQGVLIVDLETDQVLYERAPDDVVVPASNTKMFTTAAALDVLGAGHRPTVRVLASAAVDPDGRVADVFVVGEHDYTWSTLFHETSGFVADRIAEDLYGAGVREITGSVSVRGEYVVEGASLGTYDPDTERAEAGAAFSAALTAAGITAAAPSTSSEFTAPAGAVELARWDAMPLGDSITLVNSPSHNEFADLLLRHLGWELNGLSDYPQAGVAVRDWMAGLPTDASAVIFNDGSGLSHGNRTSPRNVVDLLRFMAQTEVGEAWTRSLSIGGVRGTLSSRMSGPDLVGLVWAKTGTLPSIGVVATSGYLFQRHDGRRYAFAQIFNGASDVSAARSVQDTVAGAVGADIRGLAPRPVAPTLRTVAAESESIVRLSWDPVEQADAYAVWFSPDGRTWSLDDARLVEGTVHRAGELPVGPVAYVRVTAVRLVEGGPVHSVASDVYAVSPTSGSRVLIVDGNDRWATADQPENPRGIGHAFAVEHGHALDGRAFDTAANEAVLEGDIQLEDYAAVVWMLGEESDAGRTFDDDEQTVVRAFVEGGGHLVVSGSEFGYDLAELGTPSDNDFLTDVLGVGYEGDDAGTAIARARAPLAGLTWVGVTRPGALVVGFPDRLSASDGGEVWLEYAAGLGGAALVAHPAEGTRGGTVVMGVPFEAVDDPAQRREIMTQALSYFGL